MDFYKNKPYVIADIGSNFKRTNSNEENKQLAIRQIGYAAAAGVNAAKFQLYTHKELYGYDGDDTWALPKEWLGDLSDACRESNIHFMCTAFSPDGVDLVDPFVSVHKVASSEMKYLDLITRIIKTRKPLIISTGCAHYLEVEWLINYLSCEKVNNYCLMECVAAYPAKPSDYNIEWLKNWNGGLLECGISDHTLSNTVALTSIGYGTTIFEKHFDAFKGGGYGETPDSCVSIGLEEMRSYVNSLKDGFSAVVDRPKRPCRAEDDMQLRHRRRAMAIRDINKGDPLELDWNFGAFRSKKVDYRGAPAEIVHQLDGITAKVDIKKGDSIWYDDLNGK